MHRRKAIRIFSNGFQFVEGLPGQASIQRTILRDKSECGFLVNPEYALIVLGTQFAAERGKLFFRIALLQHRIRHHADWRIGIAGHDDHGFLLVRHDAPIALEAAGASAMRVSAASFGACNGDGIGDAVLVVQRLQQARCRWSQRAPGAGHDGAAEGQHVRGSRTDAARAAECCQIPRASLIAAHIRLRHALRITWRRDDGVVHAQRGGDAPFHQLLPRFAIAHRQQLGQHGKAEIAVVVSARCGAWHCLCSERLPQAFAGEAGKRIFRVVLVVRTFGEGWQAGVMRDQLAQRDGADRRRQGGLRLQQRSDGCIQFQLAAFDGLRQQQCGEHLAH